MRLLNLKLDSLELTRDDNNSRERASDQLRSRADNDASVDATVNNKNDTMGERRRDVPVISAPLVVYVFPALSRYDEDSLGSDSILLA